MGTESWVATAHPRLRLATFVYSWRAESLSEACLANFTSWLSARRAVRREGRRGRADRSQPGRSGSVHGRRTVDQAISILGSVRAWAKRVDLPDPSTGLKRPKAPGAAPAHGHRRPRGRGPDPVAGASTTGSGHRGPGHPGPGRVPRAVVDGSTGERAHAARGVDVDLNEGTAIEDQQGEAEPDGRPRRECDLLADHMGRRQAWRRMGHDVEAVVSTHVGALTDDEWIASERVDALLSVATGQWLQLALATAPDS